MRRVQKAVFPVAGLGTRFLPFSKAVPKEMLPLVDRPVIDWAVREAVAAGLADIVLVTSRGKSAIEDYFDRAPELERLLEARGKLADLELVRGAGRGARVACVRQGEALGLGHAVLVAREAVGDAPFAVLLCDDVIQVSPPAIRQLADVYEERQASVIWVREVPRSETSRYGIVAGEEVGRNLWRLTDLVEKPTPDEAPSQLAILGRYVLSPSIFDELEATPRGAGGELQLTDALRRLAAREPVYAMKVPGRHFDLGTRRGFVEATVALALEDPELGTSLRRFLKDIEL